MSSEEDSFGTFSSEADGGEDEEENANERAVHFERFLPIANVVRVMRKTMPANSKISQSSKELVTECASEFISFITSEYVSKLLLSHESSRASERCQKDGRKTISGEDMLSALSSLGFDNYIEPMKTYLYALRLVTRTLLQSSHKSGEEK